MSFFDLSNRFVDVLFCGLTQSLFEGAMYTFGKCSLSTLSMNSYIYCGLSLIKPSTLQFLCGCQRFSKLLGEEAARGSRQVFFVPYLHFFLFFNNRDPFIYLFMCRPRFFFIHGCYLHWWIPFLRVFAKR